MKNRKEQQFNQKVMLLFGVIILLWLIALTVVTVEFWKIHIQQSEHHSEAIYKLMVENSEQQVMIDKLRGVEP